METGTEQNIDIKRIIEEAIYLKRNEDKPIIEKYRPQKFNDIVSHKSILNVLNTYIKEKNFTNMIFYGSAGVGKTSMIHSAMNELFKKRNYSTLFINTSVDRGVDVVRDKIINFIESKNIDNNDIKVIILDEFDSFTEDAQIIIKNIMDLNHNVKFCFICNYDKNIIQNIKSRCLVLKFNKIEEEEILRRCKHICCMEDIFISDESIKIIIRNNKSDIRKILNILQCIKINYRGKIITQKDVIEYLGIITMNKMEEIIQLFKSDRTTEEKLSEYIKNYNHYDIINLIYKINSYIIKEIMNNKDIEENIKKLEKLSKIERYIYSGINNKIVLVDIINTMK